MGAIGFPLALMLSAATVVIWRTRVVARWIAVVSGLAAVLEILAAIGAGIQSWQGGPQLPLWLVVWALVVSGGLLVERRRETTPTADPQTTAAT
jgi:hypothetical protein